MKAEHVTGDPYLELPVVVTVGWELYYGEPTGEPYFTAEIQWPFPSSSTKHVKAAMAVRSVLGRSILSVADAVANWTLRAQLDGHRAKGVLVEIKKDPSPNPNKPKAQSL